jgi:hypothetical protein
MALNGTASVVCFKDEEAAERCSNALRRKGEAAGEARAVLLEELLDRIDDVRRHAPSSHHVPPPSTHARSVSFLPPRVACRRAPPRTVVQHARRRVCLARAWRVRVCCARQSEMEVCLVDEVVETVSPPS